MHIHISVQLLEAVEYTNCTSAEGIRLAPNDANCWPLVTTRNA